jgi:hypothetical protein
VTTFDFSDVKEFEAFEAGTYNAKLTGYKFKTSKTGKPMVTLEFTLEDELEGRKMWDNFTLTKEALPYVKSALVALGCNPDEFGADVDLNGIIGGCIGTQCTLEVSRGTYNGKATNNVERVRQYQPSGW